MFSLSFFTRKPSLVGPILKKELFGSSETKNLKYFLKQHRTLREIKYCIYLSIDKFHGII